MTDIKKIKGSFEHIYARKVESLDDMNRVLEKRSLPKLR